ncbi:alpha-(1,3)-fucosyltransferase C-like [Ixodes scapularis]
MIPARFTRVVYKVGPLCLSLVLAVLYAQQLSKPPLPVPPSAPPIQYLTPLKAGPAKKYKVLVWNTFGLEFLKLHFGDHVMKTCTVSCRFRHNKRKLRQSDVLIFQSNYDFWRTLPPYRSPNQAYLLYAMESPHRLPYSHEKMDGVKINWTLSYRLDADIVYRHTFKVVRRPIRPTNTSSQTSVSHSPKSRPVVWIVSNCQGYNHREQYVDELKRTIQVDVYGRCGTLQCKRLDCYEEVSIHYSFYLAFENSICKDYSTEKLFLPLMHGMVPVVMGGMDYARVAPPGSYIDFADFKSPSDLGKYLWRVHNTPAEYRRFLDWNRDYAIERPSFGCTVCEGIHRLFAGPPRHYNNLLSFLVDDAHCSTWQEVLKKKAAAHHD